MQLDHQVLVYMVQVLTLSFLLHDTGVLTPLNLQTFENGFQGEIFG